MAGPTPVSALIHAATMVTSGVYLLARLSRMFVLIPEVLIVILIVGMLTAFWAAVAGLFQNDIKKVLAYSTISQLGYMFMAAGASAFDASIFHVFTHAFFKAALFLGAGAVIHSLAGEQDMRRMGGLIKKTPITACVMIFAFLAIIGFPGFAGFWSKDLILERLYTNAPFGEFFYFAGLLTAVITAVYMGRLIIMTFFGEYRGSKESEEHIHEAPASMLIPMVILAFGAVFAGYLWADSMGIKFFADTLAPVLGAAQDYSLGGAEHHVNALTFACFGTAAALLGMIIAYVIYGTKRLPRLHAKWGSAPEGFKADWTFFFDYIHEIFITMTKAVAFIADMFVDKVLQGIQWTVGSIVEIIGDGVSSFQVRKVRVQLTLSLVGVAALVAVVLLTGGLF
jgi:NADH-quinone oxidoreductase subunit L